VTQPALPEHLASRARPPAWRLGVYRTSTGSSRRRPYTTTLSSTRRTSRRAPLGLGGRRWTALHRSGRLP